MSTPFISAVSAVSSVTPSSVGSVSTILLQAQAQQYAKSYTALKNAVAAGNANSSKRALATFLKASFAATANGFDPVNQNADLRKDFQALKTSIATGDTQSANIKFATLEKDLIAANSTASSTTGENSLQTVQTAVKSGDLATAKAALRLFATNVALSATSENNGLTPKSQTITDIRALQIAFQSGNLRKAQTSLAGALANLSAVSKMASAGTSSTPFSSDLSLLQSL